MKYKFLLAILALVAVSCNHLHEEESIPNVAADYLGTVSVEYNGELYDNENISVNYTPSDDGLTADITIYQIKFVPQMPVTIDVTIPSVPLTVSASEISFSGNEIIPLAMGGEMARYLVTDLSGSIEGDVMNFSLNFGSYPTSFTGRKSASPSL